MAGNLEATAREEGKHLGSQDLGTSFKSNFMPSPLLRLCGAPDLQSIRITKQILTPHLCVHEFELKHSANGNS